jgi:hypothetical protein
VTIDGQTLTGPEYALRLANEALDLLGQAQGSNLDNQEFVGRFSERLIAFIDKLEKQTGK